MKKEITNELEMTLVKTENYKLKPFGKFTIKWKTNQGHLPTIIPYNELTMKYETSMSIPDDQDKVIIKFMVKHKTDILTDGNRFYSRAGTGFMEIWHKKLGKYKSFLYNRGLEDSPESWSIYVLSVESL